MKQAILCISAALLFTDLAMQSAHADADQTSPVAKAVRIEVKMKDMFQWESPGIRVRFFVETDSTDVPIICMADNAHFPDIVRYSVRERRVDGRKGVVVDIYFQEPVSLGSHKKAGLSINLWQPNLTSSRYPVYPTNGKKLFNVPEKKGNATRRVGSEK